MIILRERNKPKNKEFSLLDSYTPTGTVHDSINIKQVANTMSKDGVFEITKNQAKVLKSKKYLGKSGAYAKMRDRVSKRLKKGNEDAVEFLATKKPELTDALWGMQHSIPEEQTLPVVASTIQKLGKQKTKTPSNTIVNTAIQKAKLLRAGIKSSRTNQNVNYGGMFSVFRSINNGRIRKLPIK